MNERMLLGAIILAIDNSSQCQAGIVVLTNKGKQYQIVPTNSGKFTITEIVRSDE